MKPLIWFALVLCACDPSPLNAVVRTSCPQVVGARQAVSTSAFLDTLGFNVPVNKLQEERADGSTALEHFKVLGVKHLRGNASEPLGLTSDLATALLSEGRRYTFQLSLKTDLSMFLSMTRGVAEAVQVASPANDWIAPYPVNELPGAAQRWRAQLDVLPSSARPALIGPIVFQTIDATDVGSMGPWIDLGGFRYTIGDVAPSRTFGGDWEQMALGVSGGKALAASKASYGTLKAGAPGQGGLSEDVQAKYIVRLFLEGFNHGVVRTHYDALYDEDCPEGCGNGLIRIDGSKKPSYDAWAGLVTALGPPSQPAVPRALPLVIDAPNNVHSLLLTNKEGTFFLLLWLEVNGKAGTDQEAATMIQVGVPLKSAKALDLRQPKGPQKLIDAQRPIPLAVSDAPMIISLTPACF